MEAGCPFDDVTRIEDMENNREVVSDPRALFLVPRSSSLAAGHQ